MAIGHRQQGQRLAIASAELVQQRSVLTGLAAALMAGTAAAASQGRRPAIQHGRFSNGSETHGIGKFSIGNSKLSFCNSKLSIGISMLTISAGQRY
jgi:hypothetical protein